MALSNSSWTLLANRRAYSVFGSVEGQLVIRPNDAEVTWDKSMFRLPAETRRTRAGQRQVRYLFNYPTAPTPHIEATWTSAPIQRLDGAVDPPVECAFLEGLREWILIERIPNENF